ncbi:formin FRM2 [Toxoplasma gondii MAS]|uniref:Formin FRM2 n=1 Tax=Toxoplasma gondii MAS TaxID=943118 RepID=A0A086Q667_TOXGO|nr:formin FRM2 [Toxoplasma gondii MAS]
MENFRPGPGLAPQARAPPACRRSRRRQVSPCPSFESVFAPLVQGAGQPFSGCIRSRLLGTSDIALSEALCRQSAPDSMPSLTPSNHSSPSIDRGAASFCPSPSFFTRSPPAAPAATNGSEGEDDPFCLPSPDTEADWEAKRFLPSFSDIQRVFADPPPRRARSSRSSQRSGSVLSGAGSDGDERSSCSSSPSPLPATASWRGSDASLSGREGQAEAASPRYWRQTVEKAGDMPNAKRVHPVRSRVPDFSTQAALNHGPSGSHSDSAEVCRARPAQWPNSPSAVPPFHPYRAGLPTVDSSPSGARYEKTELMRRSVERGLPHTSTCGDVSAPVDCWAAERASSPPVSAVGASPATSLTPHSSVSPANADPDRPSNQSPLPKSPPCQPGDVDPVSVHGGLRRTTSCRPTPASVSPYAAPSTVAFSAPQCCFGDEEPGGRSQVEVPTSVSVSSGPSNVESRWSNSLRFNPRTGKIEAPPEDGEASRHRSKGAISPSLTPDGALPSAETSGSLDGSQAFPGRASGAGPLRKLENGLGPLGGKVTFPPRQSTLYALHAPQPHSPPAVTSPGNSKMRLSSLETGRPHPQWQLPGAPMGGSSSGPKVRPGRTGREDADLHSSTTPLCVSPQPVLAQTSARVAQAVAAPVEEETGRLDGSSGIRSGVASGGPATQGGASVLAASRATCLANDNEVRGGYETRRRDHSSHSPDASIPIPSVAWRGPGVLYEATDETLAEAEELLARNEARRSIARDWPPRGHSSRVNEAMTNSVTKAARLPGLETPAQTDASSDRRTDAVQVLRLSPGIGDSSPKPGVAAEILPPTQGSMKALATRGLGIGSPRYGLQAVSPPPPACGPVPPSPLVQTCLVAERLLAMRTPWRLPTTSILKRNNIMDIVLYLATLQNLFRGPGPRRDELITRVKRRKRMSSLLSQLREECGSRDASASLVGPSGSLFLQEMRDGVEASGALGDTGNRETRAKTEAEGDKGTVTKPGEIDALTTLLDQEDIETTRTELVRLQQRQFELVDLPLLSDSPYLLPSQQQQLVRRFLQMTPSPASGCSGLVEFNILYAYIRRKRGGSFVDVPMRKSKDASSLDNSFFQDCDEDSRPLGASMQFMLSQLDDTPQHSRTYSHAGFFGPSWSSEDSGRAGSRAPAGSNRRTSSSSSSILSDDVVGGFRLGSTMNPMEVKAALQLVRRAVQVADMAAGDKVVPEGSDRPDGAHGDVSWDQSVKTVSEATAGLMNLLEEETQSFHTAWTGGEKNSSSRHEDGNSLGLADVLSVLYPSPPVFVIWDIVPAVAACSSHAGAPLGTQSAHRGTSLSGGPTTGSTDALSEGPSCGPSHSRSGSAGSGSVSNPSVAFSNSGGVTARALRRRTEAPGVPGAREGSGALAASPRGEGGLHHSFGQGDAVSLSAPSAAPTGFEDFYRLFRDQVLRYQTTEVGAPTLQLLVHFCSSVAFWLQLDRHQHFAVINIDPGCGFQGLLLLACAALVRSKWTAAEVLQMLRRSSIAAQDGGQLERRLRGGAGCLTQQNGDASCRAAPGRQGSGSGSIGGLTSRRLGDKGRSGRAKKKTWGVICWQDAEEWPPSCRRYLHYFDRLVKRGGVEFTVPPSSADAEESGSKSVSPPSPLSLFGFQSVGETSPFPSRTPSPTNCGRETPGHKKFGVPSTPYRLKNIIMENFTPPAELVCVEVYEVSLCFGCRCRSASPHATVGTETRQPFDARGVEGSTSQRDSLERKSRGIESSPAESCASPGAPSLSSGGSTTASTSVSVQKEGESSGGTFLSPRLKLPKNLFKKRSGSPGGNDGLAKGQEKGEGRASAQGGSSSCLASSAGTVTMHSSLYAHPYIKALRQQELLCSRKTGASAGLPDRVPLLLEPAGPLGHLVPCCVVASAPPVPVHGVEARRSFEPPDQDATRKTASGDGCEGSSTSGSVDASVPHSPTVLSQSRDRLMRRSGSRRTPAAGAEEELRKGTLCCPMCCVGRSVGRKSSGPSFQGTRLGTSGPAGSSRGQDEEIRDPQADDSSRLPGLPLGEVVKEQFILRACVNNYQLMAADTMEGGQTSLVFDFSHNREGDDQYLVLSGDLLFAFRQLAATPKHSASPEDADAPPGKEGGKGQQEREKVARGWSGGALKTDQRGSKKIEWGTGQQVFATFSFHTGFMVQGTTDVQQLTKEDLDTYDSSHRDLIPDGLRVSLIFEPVRPSLFETGPAVRRPSRTLSPSPPVSSLPASLSPGTPGFPAASGVDCAVGERSATSPEATATTPARADSVFAASTCDEGRTASPRSSSPSLRAGALSDARSDDGKKGADEQETGDRREKNEPGRTKRLEEESDQRGRYGGGTGLGALASWLGFPGSGTSSRASAGDTSEQRLGRADGDLCGPISPCNKMTDEQRRLLRMMHDQQEKHKGQEAEKQRAAQVSRGDAEWNRWKDYILWRAQQWVGQPKPDRREFWRRHIGVVDEVQLWRLSNLTGCGRDNCLVALKVCCNDVADALMFLSLYFASTTCPTLVHLFPSPLPLSLPDRDFLLRQAAYPASTDVDVKASRTLSNASPHAAFSEASSSALPGVTAIQDADAKEGTLMPLGPTAAPSVGSRGPSVSSGQTATPGEPQPTTVATASPHLRVSEGQGSVSKPVARSGFFSSEYPQPASGSLPSETGSCHGRETGERGAGEDTRESAFSGDPVHDPSGDAGAARGFPGRVGEQGVEASAGIYRTVSTSSILSTASASGFGTAGASSAYMRSRVASGVDPSLGFGIEDACGSSGPNSPTAVMSEGGSLEPDRTLGSFGGWRRQRRMAPVPQRPGQLKPRQTPACSSSTAQPPRGPLAGASLPTHGLSLTGAVPLRRAHSVGGPSEASHLVSASTHQGLRAGLAPPAIFEELPWGSFAHGSGERSLAVPRGHQNVFPTCGTLAAVAEGRAMQPGTLGACAMGTGAPGFVTGYACMEEESSKASGSEPGFSGAQVVAPGAASQPGGTGGGAVVLAETTDRENKEAESPAVVLVGASNEGKELYTVRLPSGRLVRFSIDQRKATDGQDTVVHASDVVPAPTGDRGSRAPSHDEGATAGSVGPAGDALTRGHSRVCRANASILSGGETSARGDNTNASGKLDSAVSTGPVSSCFASSGGEEAAVPGCRIGVQRAQIGSEEGVGKCEGVIRSGVEAQVPAGALSTVSVSAAGGNGFPAGDSETRPVHKVVVPSVPGSSVPTSGMLVPGATEGDTKEGGETATGAGTQGSTVFLGTPPQVNMLGQGSGGPGGSPPVGSALAGTPGVQGSVGGSSSNVSASGASPAVLSVNAGSGDSSCRHSVDLGKVPAPQPPTASGDSPSPTGSYPGASDKSQQTFSAGAPSSGTNAKTESTPAGAGETGASGEAKAPAAPKKKAMPPPPPPGKTPGDASKAPGGPPGKGKAPPLPKGKKAPQLGKAPKAGGPPKKADAVDPMTLPLRRKIHWKTLGKEQIEGTVFKELEGDPAIPDMFDPEAISRLFSATLTVKSDEAAVKAAPKKAEEKKHTILDNKRAQNVAIVLARLPLSLDAIAQKMLHLDTEGLTVDILQKVEQVAPTPEELVKFREYEELKKTENTGDLRDVEKKMTALIPVTRLSSRVRVMQTALQWEKVVEEIEKQLALLCKAADEAHNSRKFRSLLQAVLQWGNYVNHGVKKAPKGQEVSSESEARKAETTSPTEGDRRENRQTLQQLPPILLVKELPTKGFKLASLEKLMEFRTTVDKSICSLHFIISNLIVSLPELDILDLASDMPSLEAAARLSDESIDAPVSYLRNEAAFLLSQIHAIKQVLAAKDATATDPSGAPRPSGGKPQTDEALHAELTRLQKLHGEMVLTLERLRESYLNCKAVIGEVGRFYGEDGPKKPSAGKHKLKGQAVSVDAGGSATAGGVIAEWEFGLLDQSPFELLFSILSTCRQGLRDVQANPRKYAILLVGRFASEEEKWKLLKFHIDNSLANRKRVTGCRGSDAEQVAGRPQDADKAGSSVVSSPRTTPRGSIASRGGKKLIVGRHGPEAGGKPQIPRGPPKSDNGSFTETQRLGRGLSEGSEDALSSPRSAERNGSARGRLPSATNDGAGTGVMRSWSQAGSKTASMGSRFKTSSSEAVHAGDGIRSKTRRSSVSPPSKEESSSRRVSVATSHEGDTDKPETLPGPRNWCFRSSKSCADLSVPHCGMKAGKRPMPPTGSHTREGKAIPGHIAELQALLQQRASKFAAGISVTSASGVQSPSGGTSEASLRREAADRLPPGGNRTPPTVRGTIESASNADNPSSLQTMSTPRPVSLGGAQPAERDVQANGENERLRFDSREELRSEDSKSKVGDEDGQATSSAGESNPLAVNSSAVMELHSRSSATPCSSPRAARSGTAAAVGSEPKTPRLFSYSATAMNPSLSPLDALQPAFSDMALAASINKALFADDMDLVSPRSDADTPAPTTTHTLFSPCGLSLFPSEREGDCETGSFDSLAPAVSAPHHFPSSRSRPATPFPVEESEHLANAGSHQGPGALTGTTAKQHPAHKGNSHAVRAGAVVFVPLDDSDPSAIVGMNFQSTPGIGNELLSEAGDNHPTAAKGEESASKLRPDEDTQRGQSKQASLVNQDASQHAMSGRQETGAVATESREAASKENGDGTKVKIRSTADAVSLLRVKVVPSTPVFCWEGGDVVAHPAGPRAPPCHRRPIICRPRRPPPPVVAKHPVGATGPKAPATATAPHTSPVRPPPKTNRGL